MAEEPRYRCVARCAGTRTTRRRRPVKKSVRATIAQVSRVAALPNGRVVSGSRDYTLKVWDVSTGRAARHCAGTRTGRRAGPASSRTVRRSLVDAAGARVWCVAAPPNGSVARVGRPHAQGLGRVEGSRRPDGRAGTRARGAGVQSNKSVAASSTATGAGECVAVLSNDRRARGPPTARRLERVERSSACPALRGHAG